MLILFSVKIKNWGYIKIIGTHIVMQTLRFYMTDDTSQHIVTHIVTLHINLLTFFCPPVRIKFKQHNIAR